MNRVSAQNSRDRKKQYVTDLEKRLKYLEDKVYTSENTGVLFKKSLQPFIMSCRIKNLHRRTSYYRSVVVCSRKRRES